MENNEGMKRRAERHARLVREAAKEVGTQNDPDVFDRAFRRISKADEEAVGQVKKTA